MMLEPRLPNGTRIGGHAIVDQIGRGGFGITYRATALESGAAVALKEYFPCDIAHRDASGFVRPLPKAERVYQEGLAAFIAEANILKALPQQAGLVRVRGAFEKFGTAYCAMDFIEGEPLSRLVAPMIQRTGFIPEGLLRSFLGPICIALETVHSTGLVHRDVKPANVMIARQDQQPILIDFGAARPSGQRGSLAMFTKNYAPPELFPRGQIRAPQRLDEGPWSDIYSLAVMLYEMASQRLPPNAQDRAAAIAAGGADPFVPLAALVANRGIRVSYSPALVTAIDAGCTLWPLDRPQAVRQFAYMAGVELARPTSVASRRSERPAERPSVSVASVSRRGPSRAVNRQPIVMVILMLLIAAAAVAYGILSRQPGWIPN
ncbi:serine/threonine protein kinase [Cereibacter sphaeroides]|uniref:serine/threonine protein kinase n=1 Tax=Cereibacter sphaeroides TaxID=1063 RepID=UPI001F414E69|nr:serine/threonine-protein kinase [Cereibacter sphaeroides]MCE6960160.1 serine/threonine protein kinase [Cereibacter sphaeroides]MCE6967942.1 serine/threonine protein kinase [Cereibacter sphaeroides]MCE6974771.1 serine/threonine protein kinase [Cereibacter sphaeroides]